PVLADGEEPEEAAIPIRRQDEEQHQEIIKEEEEEEKRAEEEVQRKLQEEEEERQKKLEEAAELQRQYALKQIDEKRIAALRNAETDGEKERITREYEAEKTRMDNFMNEEQEQQKKKLAMLMKRKKEREQRRRKREIERRKQERLKELAKRKEEREKEYQEAIEAAAVAKLLKEQSEGMAGVFEFRLQSKHLKQTADFLDVQRKERKLVIDDLSDHLMAEMDEDLDLLEDEHKISIKEEMERKGEELPLEKRLKTLKEQQRKEFSESTTKWKKKIEDEVKSKKAELEHQFVKDRFHLRQRQMLEFKEELRKIFPEWSGSIHQQLVDAENDIESFRQRITERNRVKLESLKKDREALEIAERKKMEKELEDYKLKLKQQQEEARKKMEDSVAAFKEQQQHLFELQQQDKDMLNKNEEQQENLMTQHREVMKKLDSTLTTEVQRQQMMLKKMGDKRASVLAHIKELKEKRKIKKMMEEKKKQDEQNLSDNTKKEVEKVKVDLKQSVDGLEYTPIFGKLVEIEKFLATLVESRED
ncbi:uncharacterized protein LOC105348209 isoform X2, partial [Aduncisulcus paluster]